MTRNNLKVHHYLLSISFFAILLISCNKETEVPEDDDPLLVRTVEKTGSDSVVNVYKYDGENRFIQQDRTGILNGNNMQNELKIYRNASGNIVRVTEKAAYLQATGVDSVETKFYFNASTGKYTHCVIRSTSPAVNVYDSVTYTYNGLNQIIREDHYQTLSVVPGMNRYQQTYIHDAGGNLDSVKNYDIDPVSGAETLAFSYNYDFDVEVNPLWIHNEGVLLYLFPNASARNLTAYSVDFVNTPGMNAIVNYTHTYNSKSHPVTSTATKMPSGAVSTIAWTYQ